MYIFDVKWKTQTAGPSPYGNQRTELFLLGCRKAALGNPCPHCFNSQIWSIPKGSTEYTAKEVADHLIKHSSRFLTIGGGEPLDQIDELIEVCHLLKPYDFNILVYTWRSIKTLLNQKGDISADKILELALNIDGFIDGPFIYEKKIYKESLGDGFLNSIGSNNQHIVLTQKNQIIQYTVEDIEQFYYDKTFKVNASKAGEVLWKL